MKNMKASKKEKRAIRELFIEHATLPVLILSVAVIIELDLEAIKSLWWVAASISAYFSSFSIPFLAATYFLSKAVLIYEPNIKKMPKLLMTMEEIGVTFGLTGFVFFLYSKLWLLVFLLIFGSAISLFAVVELMKDLEKENE